jgi:hypothetical protein
MRALLSGVGFTFAESYVASTGFGPPARLAPPDREIQKEKPCFR